MEYEVACNRLGDDIAQLLLERQGPRVLAAFAAGRATQDLAAAFHHAAGRPGDQLWSDALESLEHFLDYCDESNVKNPPRCASCESFLQKTPVRCHRALN